MATWQWMFTSADWILDVAQFISAPTSIRYQTTPNFWLFSLYRGVMNAPEGRVVTHFRANPAAFARCNVFFRTQHAIGNPIMPLGYWIEVLPTQILLLRRIVGGPGYDTLGFWTLNTFDNWWYQIRVTFWQAYNLNNQPTFRIRFERWEAGAWVSYGNIDDDNNYFADSSMNMMGVGARVIGPGRWLWHDDTEIWTPC